MSKEKVLKVNYPFAFYFRMNIFMRYLKLITIVERKQSIFNVLFFFCKRHFFYVPLLLHNYLKILEIIHLRFCNDKVQTLSSLQNGDTQPLKRKEGCEK